MSLAGCQIIPIDLNFHLQKYLEIFDKNSAEKIQSKNYKEVNPPCLKPIRVKSQMAGHEIQTFFAAFSQRCMMWVVIVIEIHLGFFVKICGEQLICY
jgi:hypothetical protein